MLSSDRPEFDKLAATLCSGFDRKPTAERLEAFWLGCNRMALVTFERAVCKALSQDGPDEIPTPKQMCRIAFELRASAAASSASSDPAPQFDPLHRVGMSCLSDIVKRLGVPSHESGHVMIATKNKIVGELRELYGNRSLTEQDVAELRDVIIPACEKHWKLRSAEETAANIEAWARVHLSPPRVPEQPEPQESAAA